MPKHPAPRQPSPPTLSARPPPPPAAAAAGADDSRPPPSASSSLMLPQSERCLHCDRPSRSSRNNNGGSGSSSQQQPQQHNNDNVQVRCDECSNFICTSCHWCHEFQGNHEIRVCGYCDVFYCKDCDEMDQCDDCQETVCGNCSTLLTCKFCGGGLCEECATACGRCGIVLCRRDAKFAVECDTCKMSYCLVCLAGTPKDPCLRCGQRPTKRMEQLVHLRLKSIYKAFSTAKPGDHPSSSLSSTTTPSPVSSSGAAAPAAAAAVASKKHHLHATFRTAQERADAAAAELLAEIEQEEAGGKPVKKGKKKKKKDSNTKQCTAITVAHFHPSCPSVTRNHHPQQQLQHPHESFPNNLKQVPPDSLQESGHPTESSYNDVDEQQQQPPPHQGPMLVVDPLEEQLATLVVTDDIDGLERLLASVKGVPGRAAFRKNVKKALKRIRAVLEVHLADDDEEVTALDANHFIEASLSSPKLPVGPLGPEEMLRLISDTKRARGGYECVLHMAPSIVGWVIGKGGQRVREMMDDSGARIWIDQDSMSPTAPRIVYVSGQQDKVDAAIAAIQELIAQAPAVASPRTPLMSEQRSKSTATDAGLSSAPVIPATTDAAHHEVESPLNLKPRCKAKLTCEPRYVPLLIGKRGWTIKNIQDMTGARVDIDQTVSPRQITISGREDAVKEARLMVEDVLAYENVHPLEGEEEDKEQEILDQRHPPKGATKELLDQMSDTSSDRPRNGGPEELPRAPASAEPYRPKSTTPPPMRTLPMAIETTPGPVQRRITDESATPFSLEQRFASPPSSLIVTSDVKGMISENSSLSSTPEPFARKSSMTVTTTPSTGPPPGGFYNMAAPHPPYSPMVTAAASPTMYHNLSPYPSQMPFMVSPHNNMSPRMTHVPTQFASSPPPPAFGNLQPRGGMFSNPLASGIPTYNNNMPPPPPPPLGPYVPVAVPPAAPLMGPSLMPGPQQQAQPVWNAGHPLPPPHMMPQPLPQQQQHPYYSHPECMVMNQNIPSNHGGMLNGSRGNHGEMDDLVAAPMPKELPTGFTSPNSSTVFADLPSSRDDAKVVDSLFGMGGDDYSTKELILSGLKGLGLGGSEPDLMTGLWGATTATTTTESLFSTGDSLPLWERETQ